MIGKLFSTLLHIQVCLHNLLHFRALTRQILTAPAQLNSGGAVKT